MSEINSLVRWQASHARPQMADPVFGALSAWRMSLQLPPGLSPVLSPHWNAGRRVSAQLQLQRNTSSKLGAKNVPIGTLHFSSCEGDFSSLACYRCADLHKSVQVSIAGTKLRNDWNKSLVGKPCTTSNGRTGVWTPDCTYRKVPWGPTSTCLHMAIVCE